MLRDGVHCNLIETSLLEQLRGGIENSFPHFLVAWATRRFCDLCHSVHSPTLRPAACLKNYETMESRNSSTGQGAYVDYTSCSESSVYVYRPGTTHPHPEPHRHPSDPY